MTTGMIICNVAEKSLVISVQKFRTLKDKVGFFAGREAEEIRENYRDSS